MNQYDYPISLRPLNGKEGDGFLAEVADLPGCMADGATEDETIVEVHDAIEGWVKTAEQTAI